MEETGIFFSNIFILWYTLFVSTFCFCTKSEEQLGLFVHFVSVFFKSIVYQGDVVTNLKSNCENLIRIFAVTWKNVCMIESAIVCHVYFIIKIHTFVLGEHNLHRNRVWEVEWGEFVVVEGKLNNSICSLKRLYFIHLSCPYRDLINQVSQCTHLTSLSWRIVTTTNPYN